MEQSLALAEAAQTGLIEALYALLRQNPYLLEDIDKIPFVDTPLHTAASAGCTHFANEILSLKPSFGKKLNPDGYSPIHMALASGQTQTVKQLIRYDPGLIRVKSKERFTPLHYVAEMDDADLLAVFLVSCPESIEDLTVRGETAVHIAVRNGKMRAFRVLLGWLSEANLVHILNWQDDKGDTVLHIATSTNNLEAVSLLMKKKLEIDIYKNNLGGLTALAIATQLPSAEDDGAKMLHGAFPFSASNEGSAYRFILISEESFWRQVLRLLLFIKGPNADDTTRNATLVVLVLIATATYHAMLNPPSALTQEKDKEKYSTTLDVFLLFNSVTFLMSVFMMTLLFRPDGYGIRVVISLVCLGFCYLLVMSSYLSPFTTIIFLTGGLVLHVVFIFR